MADTEEDKVKILWEKLRNTHKDDPSRLAKAISYTSENLFIQMAKDLINIHGEVVFMKKLLLGNGDVQHGLLARFNRLEEKMDTSCNQLKEINDLLLGSATARDTSFRERMTAYENRLEQVEKSIGNLNRAGWLVITAVVGQIVAQLIGLL